MSFRIAVTMPVFNEEIGIIGFLQEIVQNLAEYDLAIFIVDDCSSDSTVNKILEFQSNFPEVNLTLVENKVNMGHGPSTIKGMSNALTFDPEIVLTVDGDGQFLGNEMLEAIETFFVNDVDVLEGVRVNRSDPFFRSISTGIVRFLVWARTHQLPMDGNTPLRIYRNSKLEELLTKLPANLLTPNIFVSTYARVQNWKILEIRVTSVPSRGKDPLGSTWKQRFKHLPSKKFLKFCVTAFFQWQRTKVV